MFRRGLFGAIVLGFVLAIPAGAAAATPSAATFHGTFTTGEAYWSTSEMPSASLFAMDIRGVWNLNVVGRDATANFVVFHVASPKDLEFPPKGLDAHFVQGWMDLEPVTVPFAANSPVGRVFPMLAGVVNDPSSGKYLFYHYYPNYGQTMVASMDAKTGQFFYAGTRDDGFGCPPPSTEVPFCYDSVKVIGSVR